MVKFNDERRIPDEHKMQCLLQFVVPNSKGTCVVAISPVTAENYSTAIQQLRECFERDEFVLQIYVQEILSMVMKSSSDDLKSQLNVQKD